MNVNVEYVGNYYPLHKQVDADNGSIMLSKMGLKTQFEQNNLHYALVR